MEEGIVSLDDVKWIYERALCKMTNEKRSEFKSTALCSTPIWKATVPIIKEYLKYLDKPVARINAG